MSPAVTGPEFHIKPLWMRRLVLLADLMTGRSARSGIVSSGRPSVMSHRDATTTERKYILFNRQRTDEQVREAMRSAMAL